MDDQVPEEELRLALVLNGGVSLAVWMGGVAYEIQRLTEESGAYAGITRLARSRAVVDVISGTSAGGINGAALALAQVNRSADLLALRDLWSDRGRMEELLRTPFQGQPNSLLQGDDYFLPALNQAMLGLVRPFQRRTGPDGTPTEVDLTVTTTLLTGYEDTTTDDLGQRLPQRLHAANFRFRFTSDTPMTAAIARANAEAMALAARCTASFPLAFEPSFVPVNDPAHTETFRPDLAGHASWSHLPGVQSRYAVDGGVLANTPTKQALEAIDRRRADGLVRRAMLLVFPHAPSPAPPNPDRPDQAPTALGTMADVLGALQSQGSRTYVDQLTEHNRRAADWRGGRRQVLTTTGLDLAGLYDLVQPAWSHYRQLRIRRAALDLAERHLEGQAAYQFSTAFSFEQIRHYAQTAQLALPAPELPYVPVVAPPELPTTPGWLWGFGTALGIADAVAEIARAHLRIASHEIAPRFGAVLSVVSDQREIIRAARATVDDFWAATPQRAQLEPTTLYWTARLEVYRLAMVGGPNCSVEALSSLLEPDAIAQLQASSGHAGQAVQNAVNAVLDALVSILDDVAALALSPAAVASEHVDSWQRFLTIPALDRESQDPAQRLLQRLLALDVATWLVADGPATGTSLPVNLMQLSLQISHPWAHHSVTPDDKAAGMTLARFGGFLKRSWRMNDWAWGRLDAIALLARAVLEPRRLREIGTLQLTLAEPGTATNPGTYFAALAQTALDDLTHTLCGTEPLPSGMLALHAGALEELTRALNPHEDLPAQCEALAHYAAYPLQAAAIAEELPVIARSISIDVTEGSNPRGVGARFLIEQDALLTSLRDAAPGTAGWLERGDRALRVFDHVGLGREPLSEETGSDALIRTLTKASGAGVTLLDSERSGAAKLRPVTGVLRGALMLPYWALNGLTGAGAMARFLATLGLVAGGMLLALSILGVMGDLAPSAAAVGTASVLAAFGYAAFRSGTLLHACALIAPVAPLLAYALDVGPGNGSSAAASRALSVLGIATVLYGLARLPWPRRTPFAALWDFAINAAQRPIRLVAWAGLAIGLVLIVSTGLVGRLRSALAAWWPPETAMFAWASAVLLLVAASVAYFGGRQFRVWRSADGAEVGQGLTLVGEFQRRRLTVMPGVAAAWAPVYGCAYLGAAWGFWLIAERPGTPRLDADWVEFTWWWFGGLALVLTLITPLFMLSTVVQNARRVLSTSGVAGVGMATVAVQQELLRGLLKHNIAFRLFVRPSKTGLRVTRTTDRLQLTTAGKLLARSLVREAPNGP